MLMFSCSHRVICWDTRAPSITFEQVSLRYREGLPYALKEVSFRVEGGEKLGVAGRTGAGKSSLVRVLFRLAEVSSGRILLDDVDVLEYSLHELRTNLAAIPQDPFLFSGSVRENLSPDTERYCSIVRSLFVHYIAVWVDLLRGSTGTLWKLRTSKRQS